MPVCLGLRLYLPQAWVEDAARRVRAGVPEEIPDRLKWQIALEELDRVRAARAGFGAVLVATEYGKMAEFRQTLSEQSLTWAVGILRLQMVYPADAVIAPAPVCPTGRPPKHPVPSLKSQSATAAIAALPDAS